MTEFKSREQLMLYLVNRIGEEFPQSSILKGGMLLRLFDCPRNTNDIDYVFVPYRSKKAILPELKSLLDSIEGLKYECTMNSKALRIKIRAGNISTQIEASVAMECPSMPLSTSSASKDNNQLGRIISVMDFTVSMAHKLAAWNERNLIRDLYDVQFYYTKLKVSPDLETLKNRLKKIESRRKKMPKTMSLKQFVEKLKSCLEKLSAAEMDELRDLLPADELPGLEYRIRANLLDLCEKLEGQLE